MANKRQTEFSCDSDSKFEETTRAVSDASRKHVGHLELYALTRTTKMVITVTGPVDTLQSNFTTRPTE